MSPTGPGGSARSPGVDRREMLQTLARWAVPTVVTITLGSRIAQAVASCPPCYKRVAGLCKPCTISQQLNCQCEPCLGAPQCAAGSLSSPTAGSALRVPIGGRPGTPGGSPGEALVPRRRPRSPYDLPRQPLYRDPFGVGRERKAPWSTEPRPSPLGRSLYERLHGDSVRVRRRP